ncbi:MAG: DUF4012 domain-containing protein [Candidatus Berkelbacteria bacterium]|nr:DUF4012 domain-containing protein [Candidatus Berkelbacteria bacterium]
MRKIEDIRPGRRRPTEKTEPEVTGPVFSAEDFFAEAPSLPVIEPEKSQPALRRSRNPRKVMVGWLTFVLITISICFFCGFELLKAKTIISNNISSLNSNFSSLTEAMSKKDFAALGGQIKNLNQKTTDSVIILQSTGQDVYVMNFLYPKGKSSSVTGMIDTLRGVQMLTSSFDQILNFETVNSSSQTSTDYLAKINNYLLGFNQIISAAPAKIKNAKLFSHEAKNLNLSLNKSSFPASEQKSIESLQKFSTTSADFFDYLSTVPENLSEALSISGGKKSYLVLFLNNTEIRPGGGFIGSFARLDLENGQATVLDFETNIFTLDKAFIAAGNKIPPPSEISVLTQNWTMRDANVYPDYAKSSDKVAWFYQQETGKKVDGVISIDTTLFRNLLKIVGPIEMPEYKMTVTDQNFLSDVQYQVEIGYFQNKANWSENEPKKILSDMMPKFMSAMTRDGDVESKVGKEVLKAAIEKHFMVYSTNNSVADLLDGIGVSGKVHDSNGDYLYLSDSNLGGNKSSLNIVETVNQKINIDNDGNAAEKLTILRKHTGSYEWPDGENKNYLNILLPLSTVVDTKNLSTKVESGKTSVAYWQNTKPGETSQFEVEYHRDKAVDLSQKTFEYQITIQKQPGVENLNWNLYLVYPFGWKPQNVEGYDVNNRQIFLSEKIFKDTVFRLRFIHD